MCHISRLSKYVRDEILKQVVVAERQKRGDSLIERARHPVAVDISIQTTVIDIKE
jgi:hypothetical protein